MDFKNYHGNFPSRVRSNERKLNSFPFRQLMFKDDLLIGTSMKILIFSLGILTLLGATSFSDAKPTPMPQFPFTVTTKRNPIPWRQRDDGKYSVNNSKSCFKNPTWFISFSVFRLHRFHNSAKEESNIITHTEAYEISLPRCLCVWATVLWRWTLLWSLQKISFYCCRRCYSKYVHGNFLILNLFIFYYLKNMNCMFNKSEDLLCTWEDFHHHVRFFIRQWKCL